MVWFKPPHSHLEGNLGWLNLKREGRISSIKKLSGIRDRNCIISSCFIVIDFWSLALTQDDIRELFNLNVWNPENMTEKLTMKRNLGDWQPASVSWVHQYILSLISWHYSSVDSYFFSEALLYIYILNSFGQLKNQNQTKTKHPPQQQQL